MVVVISSWVIACLPRFVGIFLKFSDVNSFILGKKGNAFRRISAFFFIWHLCSINGYDTDNDYDDDDQ